MKPLTKISPDDALCSGLEIYNELVNICKNICAPFMKESKEILKDLS
jgi:hypothetical protein